jgi:hypothetical protein
MATVPTSPVTYYNDATNDTNILTNVPLLAKNSTVDGHLTGDTATTVGSDGYDFFVIDVAGGSRDTGASLTSTDTLTITYTIDTNGSGPVNITVAPQSYSDAANLNSIDTAAYHIFQNLSGTGTLTIPSSYFWNYPYEGDYGLGIEISPAANGNGSNGTFKGSYHLSFSTSGGTTTPPPTPPFVPSRTFTAVNEPGASFSNNVVINDVDNSGNLLFGFGNDLQGELNAGSSTLTHLAGPNGAGYLFGFNNVGQFVGTYSTSTAVTGFIYNGSTYSVLQDPSANLTQSGGSFGPTNGTSAVGVNDLGQVVGAFTPSSSFNLSAYVYQSGSFTTLNVPGAVSSEAVGINNAGDIVGDYTDAKGRSHGFLLHNGVYATIDDPAAGQNLSTYVTGINNKDQIVGYYGQSYSLAVGTATAVSYNAGAGDNGFVYGGGAFTAINYPNAGGTVVDGINDAGEIVGAYEVANTSVAFDAYAPLARNDFDGNDVSDVVLQNGGTVVDWIMKNGVYSTGNVLTTGATGFATVGAGDFNGDGTSDVLLQNGGTIVDWIMKNGSYQSGNVVTTAATGFTVVGTGDFNDDGTADVLLQNGGTVVDWIMKNGGYQSGGIITTGVTGYTVVGTGDFNGDGTTDVLLQNGGTVVDWIMKNGQYQGGSVLTTAATGYTVVGTGDFNGDGTTDVLLQNGGVVVDWIMKNGAYQSGNVITTGATGYSVVGTGDYYGTGTSDVLLQSAGTVVDWVMQNGQYKAGNVITTAAAGYSVAPS